MSRASSLGLAALAAALAFSACSSTPGQEPYKYRDLPEQPADFISAPQDPREAPQPDSVDAAAQWAIYTDRTGATTQQPHISGLCLLNDGGSELPCAGVELVLTDSHGNEIGRQLTRRSGRFLFIVDPAKKYTLKTLSGQYSARFDKPGPYAAGDFIRVHLAVK